MRVQDSFTLGALRSKRNLKKNVSVICFQKTKMGSLQFSINTAENGNAAGLLVPGFLMQPVSGERPEVRGKGAQGAGVGVGMGVVGRGGR